MPHVGTMARVYRFGRFVLEPARRSLCADGVSVPLGSRAFDILQMLIERRDTVVSRDDILSHVWHGMVVEGNTLAVQISALRRALGEPQVITTVAGRGYRFVGTLLDEGDADVEGAPLAERPAGAVIAAFPAESTPSTGRRWPAWASAMLAILVIGSLLGRNRLWPPHVAPRLSIVVLPFRNLGHDAEQDYLADAISDDLTTDLSHIPGSVVIARTSADSYKGRAVPTGEIGRALDVRYVLEGSVLAEEHSLHINAQLIDAPSGRHLWANAFDVPRDRLGEARAEIVSHIGSALNVTLVDVAGARSVTDQPADPDAVDFYLRARSILDKSYTLPNLIAARSLLEKAISKQPDFADALAELGRLLVGKIKDFDDADEGADYARAKWAIERAVSLSPQSPRAISADGYLAWLDGQCLQAEPSFQRALSLEPNEISSRVGLVRCAHALGHVSEMLTNLLELVKLDPAGADVPQRENMIGTAYILLGQPKLALEWLNRSGAGIGETDDTSVPYDWRMWRRIRLIAATQMVGDAQKARELYRRFSQVWPNVTVWRLASYESKATASLPTCRVYLDALKAAGMPAFADENYIPESAFVTNRVSGTDLEATPTTIPGAVRVDTETVRGYLQAGGAPKPFIVDVGRGAAVIPGALWTKSDNVWADQDQALLAAAETANRERRPIIVMATGPFGWRSYNAALKLTGKMHESVLWYRGGEEAWAAHALFAEDRRSP